MWIKGVWRHEVHVGLVETLTEHVSLWREKNLVGWDTGFSFQVQSTGMQELFLSILAFKDVKMLT